MVLPLSVDSPVSAIEGSAELSLDCWVPGCLWRDIDFAVTLKGDCPIAKLVDEWRYQKIACMVCGKPVFTCTSWHCIWITYAKINSVFTLQMLFRFQYSFLTVNAMNVISQDPCTVGSPVQIVYDDWPWAIMQVRRNITAIWMVQWRMLKILQQVLLPAGW